MLNPIELAWSQIKAATKRILANRMPQILTPEADLSAAESRMAHFEEIICESLTELTREISSITLPNFKSTMLE